MAEFTSGFTQAQAVSAYPGSVPAAPTPPAVAPVAMTVNAPALGLGLGTVTIIVSGDVTVTSSFPNAVIQRR